MGNGEQYIWKPPEEEEMLMHQTKALGPPSAHTVENIQPAATVVSLDFSVFASTWFICEVTVLKLPVPHVPLKSTIIGSFNIRQNTFTY